MLRVSIVEVAKQDAANRDDGESTSRERKVYRSWRVAGAYKTEIVTGGNKSDRWDTVVVIMRPQRLIIVLENDIWGEKHTRPQWGDHILSTAWNWEWKRFWIAVLEAWVSCRARISSEWVRRYRIKWLRIEESAVLRRPRQLSVASFNNKGVAFSVIVLLGVISVVIDVVLLLVVGETDEVPSSVSLLLWVDIIIIIQFTGGWVGREGHVGLTE